MIYCTILVYTNLAMPYYTVVYSQYTVIYTATIELYCIILSEFHFALNIERPWCSIWNLARPISPVWVLITLQMCRVMYHTRNKVKVSSFFPDLVLAIAITPCQILIVWVLCIVTSVLKCLLPSIVKQSQVVPTRYSCSYSCSLDGLQTGLKSWWQVMRKGDIRSLFLE